MKQSVDAGVCCRGHVASESAAEALEGACPVASEAGKERCAHRSNAEIQPLAGESSRGLRARDERTWKHGSMPGRERLRAETIRGEVVLRKRRRGEKSEFLGEGAQNCHTTDTRRYIGQLGRRRRSPRSVTETIEEPKLRKRIVEMLSLHQTGAEAATALSAFQASLPIKRVPSAEWRRHSFFQG